ncbi:MAG: ATP-binding cassette subfamily F protein 3 [Flavobacteriales bacterium]|jgi:ATP-binding cassette subfamily F protein 3
MVSLQKLSVLFNGEALFDEISYMINPNDKIGLVGKNGAGKSTMLKVLAGVQESSSGKVAVNSDVRIGYLPQDMDHQLDLTAKEVAIQAFDEVNKLETELAEITHQLETREDYESDAYSDLIVRMNDVNHLLEIHGVGQRDQEMERVMFGLGFTNEQLAKPMAKLSGGWRMRVELAKALLTKPDVLLLDEPTNHLDLESIQWLEKFLKTFPGAIVLISHDRTFLDEITNRTVEIANAKVYDYPYAYTKYQVQRELEIEQQLNAASQQKKEIEHSQELINKFRAKKNKAAFAQSLIKKLDKMERIEVDRIDRNAMSIRFAPAPRSGQVVIKIEEAQKSFAGAEVFRNVNLNIGRKEKIALVGKNGAGKTTLLKALVGQLKLEGEVTLGHNVDLGYFAQDQSDSLPGNKTVFEVVDDLAVGDVRKNIRGLLGAFLFSGDDIDKKVRVLSGGERGRLALCCLLLHPYNLLVLDEPTNHLDMESKEVLKNALKLYDGTMVVVSHDRHFLQGLTNQVYELTPTGVKHYPGDISEFLSQKDAESIAKFEHVKKQQKIAKEEKLEAAPNKLTYEDRKEEEKRVRKLKSDLLKSEKTITTFENKIKAIEKEIATGITEYGGEEIYTAYNKVKEQLNMELETWEIVSGQLE